MRSAAATCGLRVGANAPACCATDKLSSAGTQTADWMSAKGESLSTTQKQLVDDTCKYVSANPMKSLAIAVAAGFVLSRILK